MGLALRPQNNAGTVDDPIAALRPVVPTQRSAKRVSRAVAKVLAVFLQNDDSLNTRAKRTRRYQVSATRAACSAMT